MGVLHNLTQDGNLAQNSDPLASLLDKHQHFWMKRIPKDGPLRKRQGQEAGLRGRVTVNMLSQVLPLPGPAVRAVVSGPQQMLIDVEEMLQCLGHPQRNIVLLKA